MATGKSYSQEEKETIIRTICEDMIENKLSLNQAVKKSDISHVTFFKWVTDSAELRTLYNYARDIRADILFEEIIEIADTTEEGEEVTESARGVEIKRGDMTAHRRLKIDSRKWIVAKMNPRKYGDKLDVTSGGDPIKQDFSAMSTDELIRRAEAAKNAEK